MTNNKWNTIAYELYRVLNESERINAMIQEALMAGQIPTATARTSDGLRNAQIIVSTIPVLVAYPFLQRYYINGLMVGGVKG